MKPINIYPGIRVHFDIVQVGCGGNGAYLTQRLSKLISSLLRLNDSNSFSYTLVDQDLVEEKNLQRQPFLPHDIGKNKAAVLSKRYGKSYEIPIFYREQFVESVEELRSCFPSLHETFAQDPTKNLIRILIGCVDNHASRKIMHNFFEEDSKIIYIDCGVDGVLTEGDEEDIRRSGYSGHCVCGMKLYGVQVPDVVGVYPEIMEDTKSLLPSQSCGQNIVSQPQRMQSNEFAALITMGYLNQILAERRLYHHHTNFNALTHSSRPVLLPAE